MPTRTVKAHKKVGGRVSVKSYKQKYKKHRGPAKNKRPTSLRRQTRTTWLMDSKGQFTGRAGKDGETTAKKYSYSGKDYTGVIMDKLGRIYGRYKSKFGKERYAKEIKRAHPRK